jgi:ribose 5-phosphate isomerase
LLEEPQLRERGYLGKQPQLQWLSMDRAIEHCTRGASRWDFASNDGDGDADVVLGCAGDVPTLENLRRFVAPAEARAGHPGAIGERVDLGVMMRPDRHPHGVSDQAFEAGSPCGAGHLRLSWSTLGSPQRGPRANGESRFHVRGFIDQGTTTTPFDMTVLNGMSRFHLAIEALKYVSRLRSVAADAIDLFERRLASTGSYIREHLEDLRRSRTGAGRRTGASPAARCPRRRRADVASRSAMLSQPRKAQLRRTNSTPPSAAVELVQSGMVVGLGTGSTAVFAIRRIGLLLQSGQLRDVVGVPTSLRRRPRRGPLGYQLIEPELAREVDLTIDGADEVTPELDLIKGRGGRSAPGKSRRASKPPRGHRRRPEQGLPRLGTHSPLPVEVSASAGASQARFLESLGARVELMSGSGGSPFVTDEGNLVLLCFFGPLAAPADLAQGSRREPALSSTGFFWGLQPISSWRDPAASSDASDHER